MLSSKGTSTKLWLDSMCFLSIQIQKLTIFFSYSPVADAYRKSGLAAAHHRVRMCELGVENTSSWLMVDAWESLQSEYTRTADVLDHFDQEINGDGGIILADGTRRRVKIMLLAGGDLIQSFGEPGVWSEPDVSLVSLA